MSISAQIMHKSKGFLFKDQKSLNWVRIMSPNKQRWYQVIKGYFREIKGQEIQAKGKNEP